MSDTLKALAFEQAKDARNLNVANIYRGIATSWDHQMSRPLSRAYGRPVGYPELWKFVYGSTNA